MARALLALPLLLCACVEVPELDQAVPEWVDASDYPELVSLEGLQAVASPAEEAEDLEDELTARLTQLKRKANALSGPVVDGETRVRMDAGVQPQ